MKKTLLLLILFLIIGSSTFYLTTKEDTKTTILTESRKFRLENIEELHKIFLADRNGRTITLEKKQDYWQLNGKWKASPNAISNLLHTIQKLRIKYVPPRTAVPNIIKDIATHNIKVELYNRTGEKLKSYYVGGVTNDELGTHMIMENAEEPFVTYIPGFEGSLRVRYMLNELDWRDKTIFKEKLDNISFVSVEYPKQKNKSFKIGRIGSEYKVQPFYKSTPTLNQSAQKGQVENYLIGFERLVAEAFENNNVYRDSVSQMLPFSIITLKTVDNQEKTLRLHPIIEKAKNGQIILTDAGRPLVERYFAEVNGEDFMLIQQLVFGKILWTYGGFFNQH